MLLDNRRKGPLLCNGRSLATSLPTLTWKVPNVTRELVDSVARFSGRVLKTAHGFSLFTAKGDSYLALRTPEGYIACYGKGIFLQRVSNLALIFAGSK